MTDLKVITMKQTFIWILKSLKTFYSFVYNHQKSDFYRPTQKILRFWKKPFFDKLFQKSTDFCLSSQLFRMKSAVVLSIHLAFAIPAFYPSSNLHLCHRLTIKSESIKTAHNNDSVHKQFDCTKIV